MLRCKGSTNVQIFLKKTLWVEHYNSQIQFSGKSRLTKLDLMKNHLRKNWGPDYICVTVELLNPFCQKGYNRNGDLILASYTLGKEITNPKLA